jgi:hypothetical protein
MGVEKTWAVHEKILHPQAIVGHRQTRQGREASEGGNNMGEGDYHQQTHLIEEVYQFLRDQKPRAITIGENIPDRRPGPDKLAMEKVDGVRKYGALRTIFSLHGLSEGTNREKEKWQLHMDVLEACVRYGGLKNTVPLIARDVKKSDTRIYAILADLIYIFENFDDLYIEVKIRLADKFRAVWQDIMLGEKPEAIRLRYGLDERSAANAYATIWQTVTDVLPEWLNR